MPIATERKLLRQTMPIQQMAPTQTSQSCFIFFLLVAFVSKLKCVKLLACIPDSF